MLNDKQCSAEVEINNVKLPILFDLGATYNYIGEQLFERLNNPNLNDAVNEQERGEVIVGNGEEVYVLGSVNMVVCIQGYDYKVKFGILKGPLSSELILGWVGFIKPNKAILYGETDTLVIPAPIKERGALYLNNIESLAPFTESVVSVNLRYPIKSATRALFIDKFNMLLERTGVTISPGIQNRAINNQND